ncbi:MAG TPA: hypothetical protein VM099_10355, partial [Gemmatimonadaceae bacterium]|nr:hypothetical protein [Gemmatimonadaceae bacterium]
MIRFAALALTSLMLADSATAPPVVIDNFDAVDGWKAVPSDGVDLRISQDGGLHGQSMRLDFDFHGHGGYAVVHKDLNLDLPSNYEFSLSVRADAPVNNFEFKLIDPSGDNVWWSNQRDFAFPKQWKTVTRKKRQISFAWGPLGGGEMKKVAAIEFAITAGSGGKGTVWIDDLQITPLDADAPYTLTPRISSTGNSYDIDFLKRREFGGLIIDWKSGQASHPFTITGSRDGTTWETLYTAERAARPRSYVFLPESDERYIRISTSAGIREVKVEPLTWSASPNDFFMAIAKDAPAGSYPKYFSNTESYWTVLGVDGDTREALIDEQGMIETGKGKFSIEPFLFTSGRLITWRDATRTVASASGYLPIKTVTWKTPSLSMDITAFAAGVPESSVVYARYTVHNSTSSRQKTTLYLAARPFQVNPPWQFLNSPGGVARIDSISWNHRYEFRVNGERVVVGMQLPTAFGAMTFDEGNIVDFLRNGHTPPSFTVRDSFGHASGAFAYELDLAPHSDSTIDIAVPLHRANSFSAPVSEQLARVTADWQRKLNLVQIDLPSSASRVSETVRSQLAYILINRDGPGIQPGSRSYERSWIRDGSLTSTALLRLGHFDEVRDYIKWYSKFQFDNGKIPCCVDSRGADPVPENDSHGEFIYLIAEYYRHTHDRELLERTWPNVAKAWTFMDSLRRSRKTPEYEQPDKRVFYGLLPQSISHEGYSAKPMHSYWDDFFALRGFKDAAEIAHILGKPEESRYATVRDAFRNDFYASIKLSMALHRIDYIPGAAELGDFDATSTTIALEPAGELNRLPQPALNRTFDKYYENFVARRDGKIEWDAYTPYEWRVVGSFIRLGQKNRAHEAMNFFFQGQRPAAWRQWAEVVYRDPKTPKFIGDMPHTWVGSDFIRSSLDMFAYERESDSSLVIAAGIPESWVRQSGVRIQNLSTHYGRLSYSMRAVNDSVVTQISGSRIPPGGLIIESPIDRPVRSV